MSLVRTNPVELANKRKFSGYGVHLTDGEEKLGDFTYGPFGLRMGVGLISDPKTGEGIETDKLRSGTTIDIFSEEHLFYEEKSNNKNSYIIPRLNPELMIASKSIVAPRIVLPGTNGQFFCRITLVAGLDLASLEDLDYLVELTLIT